MRSSPKKKQTGKPEQKVATMPLRPLNYLFIAAGALVIVLAYLGMYLENSVNGIFSLHVAPVLLITAYLWVLFALFYRPKEKKKSGTP